jgi:hypothetical protein
MTCDRCGADAPGVQYRTIIAETLRSETTAFPAREIQSFAAINRHIARSVNKVGAYAENASEHSFGNEPAVI